MRYEILIGGYGGQGILLAGYVIGHAAVMAGYEATYVPSYGPEARGGRCASRIVISDSPIDYPLVRSPDCEIFMYKEAYDTYIHLLKPGGILIVDADLVKLDDRAKKAKVFKIPATRMAEHLGRRIVANSIMIGAFTAITKLIPYEIIKKSLFEAVREKGPEINLRALEEGYNYAKKLLGEE